jgi:hypothetical protein
MAHCQIGTAVGDETLDALEVVREGGLSVKAASDLGKDERAAAEQATDGSVNPALKK